MRCILFLLFLFVFCCLTTSAFVSNNGKCPASPFRCGMVCTPDMMTCKGSSCCSDDSQCAWNQKCCPPPSCGCVKYCMNVAPSYN